MPEIIDGRSDREKFSKCETKFSNRMDLVVTRFEIEDDPMICRVKSKIWWRRQVPSR